MELTDEQFELLASFLRSRGVSREASKRVLVLGQRQCVVARELNVSPNLIAEAIKNYRRSADEIDRVFRRPYMGGQ